MSSAAMIGGYLSTLPPELRVKIYSYLLCPDANKVDADDGYSTYGYHKALQLFLVNKQCYYEARDVFRSLNVFVCIQTPWPQAKDHVAAERQVPIVLKDEQAAKFRYSSLRVSISAPSMEAFGYPTKQERFVILLDDLPKFTRTWYYTDLTNPLLNSNLRLTLELLAPYTPSYEEQTMKKDLQRRLLLPFGEVKNLQCVELVGTLQPYRSVAKELADLQAEKTPSPEHCLREATRLKELGNAALASKKHQEALEFYRQAWEAMHIVIRGDQRHVHADHFFGRTLTEEPYKDKNGQTERLLIRVALVAKTCLAYLELQEYQQCIFWGMRSITMLRQALGVDGLDLRPEEEAVTNFPSTLEFGYIYRWTACACKAVGDRQRAYNLFEVAREYLPRDRESIDAEMAGLLDGTSRASARSSSTEES